MSQVVETLLVQGGSLLCLLIAGGCAKLAGQGAVRYRRTGGRHGGKDAAGGALGALAMGGAAWWLWTWPW